VPTVRGSIEQLGFKYADVKIVLGSHAHADHMEGDALVKQLTGATVMAMAEDVPALEKMMPGGKPHPIDKVLHDGDEVKLGGMTLVAHLTPGHTRGCTTWTFREQENGRNYEVLIIGSVGVNPGMKLVNNPDAPQIADEFNRAFCDAAENPSRCAAWITSWDVQHGGQVREGWQGAEPVHRPGGLHDGTGHRRRRVQIAARATAEAAVGRQERDHATMAMDRRDRPRAGSDAGARRRAEQG
jgi:hypothetical protein